MKKTFLEIFHKYHPDTYTEKLLLTITDLKLMADKELKIIEITANFPQIVEKAELYRIQEEICKAYDLNRVKILPKYAAELFDEEYIPQLYPAAFNVLQKARIMFVRFTLS